jgi:hypothetical protein
MHPKLSGNSFPMVSQARRLKAHRTHQPSDRESLHSGLVAKDVTKAESDAAAKSHAGSFSAPLNRKEHAPAMRVHAWETNVGTTVRRKYHDEGKEEEREAKEEVIGKIFSECLNGNTPTMFSLFLHSAYKIPPQELCSSAGPRRFNALLFHGAPRPCNMVRVPPCAV